MAIMAGQANVEELFASGRLIIDGNLGLATLLPQAIDMALRGNQAPAVEANRRYPPSARPSDALSAAQPPLTRIERRPRYGLSVDEFRQHYMLHGIPLVISDALHDVATHREAAMPLVSCVWKCTGRPTSSLRVLTSLCAA